MFTVEYAKCTAHAHTQQSDCTVTQVWASAATCCWIQLNAVTLVKPIRRDVATPAADKDGHVDCQATVFVWVTAAVQGTGVHS